MLKRSIFFSLLFLIVCCTSNHDNLAISNAETDLFPQIIIKSNDSTFKVVKGFYSNAELEISGTAENEIPKQLVSIKGRGNTTWSFPKKSFQIKFDSSTSILDLPAGRKFVLLANYSDKSMLRNELAFSISRLSQLDWTPESQFIELTINDEYKGVYLLTQKIEIDNNSLDPNKTDILLEIDHLERLHEDDIYFKTAEHLFCLKETHIENINSTLATKEFISSAERSIMLEQNYEQYFDIISLVDWYLINEIAKNNDALFNSSVYLHYKVGQKIQMGPVWDYDIAFGNINYNGNDSVQGFFIKNAAYFQKLFKQDLFVILVKERFNFFYQNKEQLLSSIDAHAKRLEYAADRNFKKWLILGKYIWPNAQIYATYEEEVGYLKEWFSKRMDWLDSAYSKM